MTQENLSFENISKARSPLNFLEADIIKTYPSGFPYESFFGYSSNLVSCEQFISVAGVLAPPLIEKDGKVFLKEHEGLIEKDAVYERFKGREEEIERYVNMVSLWDFFLLSYNDSAADEALFRTFTRVLKQFWEMYLAHQYPDKQFIVEIAEKGLYYEKNLCMTFYQKANSDGDDG